MAAEPHEETPLLVGAAEEDSPAGKKGRGEPHERPNLWKTFKLQRRSIIVSITFEFFICLTFTQWARITKNEKELDAVVWDVRLAFWSTFVGFLVLRACILGLWKMEATKTCILGGLYMFCSTFQFVLYIAYYYMMREKMTTVTMNEHPDVAYHNDTSSRLGYYEECTLAYNPDTCDGYSNIGGIQCCVRLYGTLSTATAFIPIVHWDVKWTFSIAKWLMVLMMTWVWKDAPLVKYSDDDKAFLGGVWLDLLDALIFSSYIEHPAVQNPHYGLVGGVESDDVGRPCMSALGRDCKGTLHDYVWFFWFLAFTTALLSPTIYTLCMCLDKDDDEKRKSDDALDDLKKHVHLLNEVKARADLNEALKLQLEEYTHGDPGDADPPKHKVVVHSDNNRRGDAVVCTDEADFGCYMVTFDDNQETKKVKVDDLYPDMDHHIDYCGHRCCHGWLHPHWLCPSKEKHKLDQFERRAKWLDAIRAAFCLEIPFFIFRFYFDLWLGGFPSIFLLKNLVMGVIAFMLVLTCGNEGATCCSMHPIKTVNGAIKGSKLTKAFVGPSALVRLATDLYDQSTKNSLENQKKDLEAAQTWMIVERKKWKDKGEEALVYHDALATMQKRLDAIDKKEKMLHI